MTELYNGTVEGEAVTASEALRRLMPLLGRRATSDLKLGRPKKVHAELGGNALAEMTDYSASVSK